MLAFVPVTFDLYRPLKAHLRWTLQVLVSFADRRGQCWPSVRKLAEYGNLSKSAAARHLIALEQAGAITRQRRPGRASVYQIAPQFLPRAPLSHPRPAAVPRRAGQETEPGKQIGQARARFVNPGLSYSELPDDRAKWQARLRSWRQSGFWLAAWGARPGEAACIVPPKVLEACRSP